MIRIAICDDNELQLEITQVTLQEIFNERTEPAEIVSFSDGRELIGSVKGGKGFDIYFLDVVMPGMNGMEIAATLRMLKDDGAIIFLSSSIEYAVQSYDVDAYYYFLKPLDRSKLARILDKLLQQKARETLENELLIQTEQGTQKLHMRDIAYVALENRRVKYVLKDGRFIQGRVIRGKFREEIAGLLSCGFFHECGTSLAVRMDLIDVIDDESILLSNGELLYASKSAVGALKQFWLSGKKTT